MSLKDFKIGKQLGKGAFGSVCIVTRLADQKTYAMKQVKISSLSQKERENAVNEIRILASLQHPNIVGYYEAFYESTTKTMNIVMEFADDGDLDGKLKQCIKSHRIFDESQMWSWIIQLLEGLKYLHDNKIIHRDLKCANLFLMKNGLLKIGDLNVSKLNKQKYAQTQTGTPYYCAPEIWEDKPYDYKCDIWSVGCILYELCTHHPPFRGTSLRDLYQNVMKGRYEPISNAYSSDLRNFIGKMLILDPRKRPTVSDLLNTEIIKKKIDEKKNNNIIAKVVENSNAHANFIKTIKLPKNLNDINRALPKKRYKNIEKEMMENDEFETKKAEFFKNAMNDVNKNNNNVNNNQPINNFNKQLLINKNNNKNNNNYNNNNYNNNNNNYIDSHKKDNNPIKINNNNIVVKEISRQKDEERKKEEERRRKEEQRKRELYLQELKQQQIQKQQQQQQKNYINNNLINYNGNAEYIKNKNIDIYNRPKNRPESSKPSSNYQNSNNNNNIKIPSSRQDRYKNLFGDQPPESHHHHHHNPPSNNNNSKNNNDKAKYRPQSGRIQENHHHHKNNLVNDNKNNNGLLYNYNYNSPSYQNKNYNNYNNNYNNNNRVVINKKKPKKVVYEKIEYKKKQQNNQNRFGFNNNKYIPVMKVNNKNNLEKAMGVGDINHIHRKGPKIVNIKK